MYINSARFFAPNERSDIVLDCSPAHCAIRATVERLNT